MAAVVTNVDNVFALNDKTGGVNYGTACTITFDATYPAGGEVLDATALTALGLTNVNFVLCQPRAAGTEYLVWDRAADKIKIFTADGIEAAGDQSAVSGELFVIGN